MENLIEKSSSQIMQFITAKWINQPLYVVTKLEIPDILSEGAKSIKELSEICNINEHILYRVMRALACVGIFYEKKDKMFDLTPMAECLQKDKMRSIALMFLSEWHNKAWDNLFQCLKTGDIAFNSAYGMPSFEWFKINAEEAKIFNEANTIKAMTTHATVLNYYDFSRFKSVIDIGGGFGGLLFKILQSNKFLKGIIADLPYMHNDVKEKIINNNLFNRCSFISCDFFKKIPEGSDCCILSNILHDWDDDKCKIILENCYDSINITGQLLIIESIIPSGNEFSIAKLLDLEVLVMGGGQERTEEEFRKIINSSGFVIGNIIQTQESISIIECIKK
jgi:hypothetical protein